MYNCWAGKSDLYTLVKKAQSLTSSLLMSDMTDKYSRGRAGKSGLGWSTALAAAPEPVTVTGISFFDTR